MNRFTRRFAAVAAAGAALVVVPAAIAGNDKLELSVVSSPAEYVSGGDARIEVAVPAGTALSAVDVTLNGVDVTSSFGPDPEGNHQLEGVVTGLPLGESTVAATAPGPGKSQRGTELTLTNNPIQGPIFSGPHQVPFVCATAGNAAGMGLPPIPQSPTCETPTVVSYVYRPTDRTTLFPYDPAAPPPASSIRQTTTMDGLTVPMIVRWERGVINRFMYSIMVLSPYSQTSAVDLRAWNRKALFSFSGGVAIGHTREPRAAATCAIWPACRWATRSSTRPARARTPTTTSSSAARRRSWSRTTSSRSTRSRSTRSASAAPAARSSSTSTGRTIPGLLDGGVPQYSYPDMVTQTIHVGDCELLERWADSKAAADPLSMWRTWVNRTLIEGLNASAAIPESVRPLLVVPSCRRGSTRVHQRLARPLAARAQPALVRRGRGPPGYNPAVHGPVEWTHWGDLVNIYGTDEKRLRPDAVGQRRRPVRAGGAPERRDHARRSSST